MSCNTCKGTKCKGECADPKRSWTLQRARNLCTKLEAISPEYGAHIALTGGVLYREGPRKDCDIVVYRHGGRVEAIDRLGFLAACMGLGMEAVRVSGRVWKLRYEGRQVDILLHDADEAALANPNNDGSSA